MAAYKKEAPTTMQARWRDAELDKIYVTGDWQVINNYLTFITPWHYLALNHWPAGLDTDDGKKDYRDKDRRRWLHFYTGYMDKTCFGQNYLKRRRDGASSDGGMLAFWFTSRENRKAAGMASYNDEEAQNALMKFVLMPFFELEDWLQPIHKSTLASKDLQLIPKDGGRSGNMARNSRVYTRPIRGKGFDGGKLIYLYGDEFAKWDDKDLNEYWRTHTMCLKQGPYRVGFSFWTSTVEKMGKHVENAKKFFGQGIIKISQNASGSTASEKGANKGSQDYKGNELLAPKISVNKTWSLFIEAYDGYDGFIDFYGESIIDDPTDEQWVFMQSKGATERIGAKEYQRRARAMYEADGDTEGLQHLKRQEPWTVQEAFDNNNVNCHFNLMYLTRLKDRLIDAPPLYRQGNFHFDGPDKVVFVEDAMTGRFWISWFPPAHLTNMIQAGPNGYAPLNKGLGVIGVDPFGSANVVDKKRASKGAIHGKLYFDYKTEAANKAFVAANGKDMPGYWPTPSVFLEYLERPTTMAIFYDDILKAAIFFGMPISLERNINGLESYLMTKGYGEMMLSNAELKGGLDCSHEDYIKKGISMTEDLAVECLELINNFINGDHHHLKGMQYNLWEDPRRLPFLRTIDNLINFSNDNRTIYDLVMSFMQVHKAEWGMTDMSNPFFQGSDATGIFDGFFHEEINELDDLKRLINKRVLSRKAG